MGRTVQVVTWCDVCATQDVEATGEAVTVAVDGMRATSVDLCDDHRKQLLEPLVTVLREHGVKPEGLGRAPAAADLACPQCGYRGPSEDSVQKHCMREHQRTITDLRGTSAMWCPQCGLGWERYQGLAMHMRTKHKIGPEEARQLKASGQLATKPSA